MTDLQQSRQSAGINRSIAPSIARILEPIVGGELPVLSQWMMAWGGFLDQYGGLLLAVLGGLVYGVCRLLCVSPRMAAWGMMQSKFAV